MKWATNKRLHFELGVIKSIQTLGEVRITDVIKVLTRGADFLPTEASATIQAPSTAEQPVADTPAVAPEPVVPKPAAAVAPAPEPEPAPVPVAKEEPPAPAAPASPAPSGFAAFDSFIDAAPEVSEPVAAPEPPPWKEEAKPVAEAPAPAPPVEDTFHQDPLIQSALEKFEGKVISN
jgi:DNA polymerase-3 subunit gamma/tau